MLLSRPVFFSRAVAALNASAPKTPAAAVPKLSRRESNALARAFLAHPPRPLTGLYAWRHSLGVEYAPGVKTSASYKAIQAEWKSFSAEQKKEFNPTREQESEWMSKLKEWYLPLNAVQREAVKDQQVFPVYLQRAILEIEKDEERGIAAEKESEPNLPLEAKPEVLVVEEVVEEIVEDDVVEEPDLHVEEEGKVDASDVEVEVPIVEEEEEAVEQTEVEQEETKEGWRF